MSYIVDDLDRWTYGTMSTLDYTSTGEWYITTRGEIHDAVYAILATNGLDTEELLTAAGINDTVIDTIINGTVEILLHGYIWDWESDYWIEHLTWIINTEWYEEELYHLIDHESTEWELWMTSYPEDYLTWLEDNEDARNVFIADYEYAFYDYLGEDSTTWPEVWV